MMGFGPPSVPGEVHRSEAQRYIQERFSRVSRTREALENRVGLSMGSTFRERAAAGIATEYVTRRIASIWFLVVVRVQTFAQPTPRSEGSTAAIFCGLFVRQNQSGAGVARMSC